MRGIEANASTVQSDDFAVNAIGNGRAGRRRSLRWWSRATDGMHDRISDDIDSRRLDSRWPEPDGPSDGEAPGGSATPEHQPVNSRPASRRLCAQTRRLWVAGLVIVAMVVGSAGTHWFDQPTRSYTLPWMAACHDAINATARFQRLQDIQFVQGLESVWAPIGGGDVPKLKFTDSALIGRLQRDADLAISRCVSPAAPQS